MAEEGRKKRKFDFVASILFIFLTTNAKKTFIQPNANHVNARLKITKMAKVFFFFLAYRD